MIYRLTFLMFMLCAAAPAAAYVSGTPVPTDSRIKTFVYNANDVYRVLTHYGYQMNIEFGEDEEIETVSVGDRTGWQITPGERRLFIRAMDDKAQTNMTVVTNERTYQFDLYAAKPGEQGWDELVYVVRFFYPPEDKQGTQFSGVPAPAMPMMTGFSPPMMSAPMMPPAMMMAPAPAMPQFSLLPPPSAMPAPMMMPPVAPPPMMMPPMATPPMMMPPMTAPLMPMPPQQSYSLPMGTPLLSPALPPVSAPPMAGPGIMARPATPVPPVNVTRSPYGMIAPPQMSVAPPPVMPNPRAPFVANQMTPSAQQLARKYPYGSYNDPIRAPRQLPSLDGMIRSSPTPTPSMPAPQAQLNYPEPPPAPSDEYDPVGLPPLPSELPGNYIQF